MEVLLTAGSRVRAFLKGSVRGGPSASNEWVERVLWGLAASGIVIVGLLPFIVEPRGVLLGVSALVFSLFALSLNLLVGTTGLVSFGHAAYFGLGAYTVVLLASKLGWSPMVGLGLAPIVGAIGAFLAGLVVLRGTELYFALLTLGVGQVYWATAQGWFEFTRGEQGIHGFFRPEWLASLNQLYWFVFGIVCVCAGLLFVITNSPFGNALRGIRENRLRAENIGINVKRYELAAFVLAGTFASIAGALFAFSQGFASSALMHWTSSAEPMVMILIGGIGAFGGPVVGAYFYTYMRDVLVAHTQFWEVTVGALLVVVVLLVPGGLAAGIRGAVSRGGEFVVRRRTGLGIGSGAGKQIREERSVGSGDVFLSTADKRGDEQRRAEDED